MIDGKHALSISRQAQLAGISRGSVYYLPRPVNFSVQKLMRRIDPLHLEHPFMGARMLRDLAINRANQVWALDTTFIPIAKGFVYLTAVVDWASRRVLAAKVAITLEAYHAVDVLQEAFSRHGRPEIVNTDQDSQFTAHEFVQAIKDRWCKPSMDGRGAWRDNVLVERLWKSVKYERVYLHAYDSVTEARASIMQYMDWYNQARPHSGLERKTPDEAYAVMLPTVKLAAWKSAEIPLKILGPLFKRVRPALSLPQQPRASL